jgi:fructose-bisphosphate aldolase class II
MPVADYQTYREMLERARRERFAYPAIVDTDMRYAFTRAVAGHCFAHYDGVLRVDGGVGAKNASDPRTYLALAEQAMAERVKVATADLRSAGMALVSS